ncbi:MAG: MCE family protein [Chlorobi bacterium]|nr:MCE family protein [Chlorobiota bacterium]
MSIIKKEIKIGVVAIVALMILGWGLNFLKGRNVLSGGVEYYGIYSNVSGLDEANPIYYRGLKIGSVRKVELHPTRHDKLLVTFNIVKDISFPKNSVAKIYSLDLMGTKGVEFVEGDSKEMLQPGDTIRTYVLGDFKDQLSIEVLPLKEKTEKLIVNFDSLILNINQIFKGENKNNIEGSIEKLYESLDNISKMTGSFAGAFGEGGEYNTMLKRMDSIMIALNRQTPYLDTTLSNLAGFSDKINKVELDVTLQELNKSLIQATKMFQGINESEGSLGMLFNDKELYYNLVDASANLNRLLLDVRHQPKKYVHFSAVDFGKTYYPDEQNWGMKGIVFQVKLFESKSPVKLEKYDVADKYRIFEDFDGKKFIYTIGQSRDYKTIQQVLKEASAEYPDCKIIALENGRPISLDKAIRKINN